jgi:hypothetical protein
MALQTYRVIRVIPMHEGKPIEQQVGEFFTLIEAEKCVERLTPLELGVTCHYKIVH